MAKPALPALDSNDGLTGSDELELKSRLETESNAVVDLIKEYQGTSGYETNKVHLRLAAIGFQKCHGVRDTRMDSNPGGDAFV